MMQHLILLFALLALPVSAVMAEEQGATDDERDQFTYEESATDDDAQSDAFLYEETATDDDAATRQDAAFPEEDEQTGAATDDDWDREGTMRTETATVGAEDDDAQAQEERVGFEQEGQQDQQFGQQQQGEASVARQQFASDVQDKEPVDQLTDASTDEAPIFFFTEVEGAEGETITHRWIHEGEVMAEVDLDVGSDSWRTWSSKEMMPDWDGEWRVEVVDSQGNVLAEDAINVQGGEGQFQQAGFQDDQAQQDEQDMGAEQQQVTFEDDQDWDAQQQEATFEDDQDMDAERQEIRFEDEEDGFEVEQREIGAEDDQDAQDDDNDSDWDW